MTTKTDLFLAALPMYTSSLFVEWTGILPSNHTGYIAKSLFVTISTVFFSMLAKSALSGRTPPEDIAKVTCSIFPLYFLSSAFFQFSHFSTLEIILNGCVSCGLIYAVHYYCKPLFRTLLERAFWDEQMTASPL